MQECAGAREKKGDEISDKREKEMRFALRVRNN